MWCATQINPALFSREHIRHMLTKMHETQVQWMVFMSDEEANYEPQRSPFLHIRPLPTLPEWFFQLPTDLPTHRNATKDTYEHLKTRYVKYACIHQLSQELGPDTVLGWMEPDDMFFSPTTSLCLQAELQWIQAQIQTAPLSATHVYIPGEWGKIKNKDDVSFALHSPHWRFGGNCIFGKMAGFVKWVEVMEKGIAQYYETHPTHIQWDFNVMAWTEYNLPDWPGIWYAASPNGSVFQLPVLSNLSIGPEAGIRTIPDWPIFPGLFASSASRVDTPRETVIHIRYVNYYIQPNGQYTFPFGGQCLHTQNYAIVQRPDGSEYRGWVQEQLGLSRIPGHVPMATGLEDVRLYYDARSDCIRFVATTLEYSITPKIMTGVLTLQGPDFQCVLESGQVLASPGGESTRTRWEKNWIPVEDEEGTCFVYKWGPIQIGRLAPNGELSIHKEYNVPWFVMNKVCGSSPFIRDTLTEHPRLRDQYIGVVHYGNNRGAVREYVHLLIWLDIPTLKPLAISQPFTFTGQCIEYCLSVRTTRDQTYEFIVSIFDRNPVYMEVLPCRFIPSFL